MRRSDGPRLPSGEEPERRDPEESALTSPEAPGEEARRARDPVSAQAASPARVSSHDEKARTPVSEPEAGGKNVLPRGTNIDRYVLLDRLGAGAMGIVYAAYDPELDRKVALKVMSPALLGSARAEEFQHRLLREAQAMARVRHPHVITVHDTGTFRQQAFVAMEFIDGGTLRHWMRAQPRTWAETLAMMMKSGQGLAAAHQAGLVHRDFKPDNVLVGKDGGVHVTDFGLARATALDRGASEEPLPFEDGAPEDAPLGRLAIPLTETGVVMGTPSYMAPEQFRGHTDPRSDQFSFCVALYEGLYGERPFKGRKSSELFKQIITGQLPAPPPGSTVPPSLRRILEKGLSPRPEERYPSMQALLEALEAVKDPRKVRRQRLWLFAGASVALLVSGLGLTAAVRQAHVCDGAEEAMVDLWDTSRKAAIHEAFLKTGQPYAETAWHTVETVLDAYRQDWLHERTEACLATKVRRQWSEEIYGLRLVCLETQRKRLETLTHVFAKANAAAVENAVSAVSSFPDAKECGDVAALTSRVKRPEGLVLRARVEKVRAQVAEAQALLSSGQESKAFDVINAAATALPELRFSPVEAEVRALKGTLEVLRGNDAAAEKELLQALYAAEAGRHDEAAVRAWTILISLEASRLSKPQEALRCADHAEALIQALGGDEKLRLPVLSELGGALSLQGRNVEALDTHRRALALAEKLYPKEHPAVARAYNNLGQALAAMGELNEAVTFLRRALVSQEKSFGPDHPALILVLSNLGNVLVQQGEYPEAVRYQRRALELARRKLGPENTRLALYLKKLAVALYNQGGYDEALPLLHKALALEEKAVSPDSVGVAYMLIPLAECLQLMNRHDESMPYLRRAKDIIERSLGADNLKVELVLSLLGFAAKAQGRKAEALAYFQRGVDIQIKALGKDNPLIASDLAQVGELSFAFGHDAQALEALEKALLLQQKEGAPDELGETQFALAQVLWKTPKHRARAQTLLQSARENLKKSGPIGDSLLKELEHWQAKQQGP